MNENNYNETFHRLTSTNISYQRLISNTIGNTTIIRYIGNYLRDSQDTNLILTSGTINNNSKNKSFIISQITLISTNPFFSSYLPLKISLGNVVVTFIADYNNPLVTLPLITENQGYQDRLINNQWNKFTQYTTAIVPDVLYNQVVITKTSNTIDLVNDRIFVSNDDNLYVSTVTDMINKTPFTLLMTGIGIQSRLKTNGYNVVFAKDNFLVDASFTPVRVLLGENIFKEFICYDPFSIDGNRGIIAIQARPGLIEPYDVNPVIQLINDDLINNTIFISNNVTNNEKEILSRCISIVMINYHLAIGISWGRDIATAGSIVLIFLDTINKIYRVKVHTADIFENFDYQNLELITFFQNDNVISLNEKSVIPLNYNDNIYKFSIGFNYTTPDQINIFINADIDGSNIVYKTLIEDELDLGPESILFNRRYRNLLISNYSDKTPIYKIFNSTDSTQTDILKIEKLNGLDTTDFYVNQHYFIEVGKYKFNNIANDVIVLNLSINERDDPNKLTSYTRDYFNLEIPFNFISAVSFKLLDEELYDKLEIVKVIVDVSFKNSYEKQSNPKETISNKKDKLKRKLRKADLDIKNVLGGGEDEIPLIRDILHLV